MIRHLPKILVLLIALGLVIFIIRKYQLFFTRRITCFTQFGPCHSSLTTLLASFQNTDLSKALPLTQIRRALSPRTDIKEVKAYRRLPHTLVIAIILRQPVSSISDQVMGSSVDFDSEGVVFAGSTSAFPLIVYPQAFLPGQKVADPVLEAGLIMKKLSPLSPHRLIGYINKDDLITSIRQIEVVIGLKQQPSSWLSSLQLILDRSKMDSKTPKKIDLRFSQPVVTY